MNSNKEHWILCPACGSKTRARLLPDTVSVGSFNSVLKNSGYILIVHDDCADTDIQNSIVTGYAHIFVHCFSTLSPFCYFKTYFHALLS